MDMETEHSLTQTESSAIGLLSADPILESDYFRRLESGSMPKADFVQSQLQFFHTVDFFSRNLAALASRLPTSAGRAVLVHNLSEEHGLDEENPAAGFRSQFAHDRMFARFLETLNIDAKVLAASVPEPAVRVPRRRRRLGVQPLQRHPRPLGQAQPRHDRPLRPRGARP